jgi:hypothetical protein
MGLFRNSLAGWRFVILVLAISMAASDGSAQMTTPVVTPGPSGTLHPGHVPVATTDNHTITDIGAVPAHTYLGNNTASSAESDFVQPAASDISGLAPIATSGAASDLGPGYQPATVIGGYTVSTIVGCATRQLEITKPVQALPTITTITLPNGASCMKQGQALAITDNGNFVGPANYAQLITSDLSTINGATTDPITDSATIPTLQSPGSVMLAVWDGFSNWRVTVMKQPTRTYDLARDFGAVPASIINSSACTVDKTTKVFVCTGASLTQADKGDVFVAEGLGSSNVPFVDSVASVTNATSGTLTDPPSYGSTSSMPLYIIDGLTVDPTNADGISSGSNYAFSGPTECLAGGTVSATPVCGMQMALGAVHAVSVGINIGFSGSGTCTGSLAQSVGSPLNYGTLTPNVATFSISFSGGVVTVGITSEGLYKNFAGYSYGSSGYANVPVTLAGCPISASLFINVEFGVVTENFLLGPNGYTVLPPDPDPPMHSCDKTHAAATYTTLGTGFGTGLRLYCSSHMPWASAYQDAAGAMENAIDFESAQNTMAHQPVCVTVRGRFGITPIPWTSHIVNGAPCFIGDAQIESGFFKTPNAGMGAIIPFADASAGGG